jgi:hypothetical protein
MKQNKNKRLALIGGRSLLMVVGIFLCGGCVPSTSVDSSLAYELQDEGEAETAVVHLPENESYFTSISEHIWPELPVDDGNHENLNHYFKECEKMKHYYELALWNEQKELENMFWDEYQFARRALLLILKQEHYQLYVAYHDALKRGDGAHFEATCNDKHFLEFMYQIHLERIIYQESLAAMHKKQKHKRLQLEDYYMLALRKANDISSEQ